MSKKSWGVVAILSLVAAVTSTVLNGQQGAAPGAPGTAAAPGTPVTPGGPGAPGAGPAAPGPNAQNVGPGGVPGATAGPWPPGPGGLVSQNVALPGGANPNTPSQGGKPLRLLLNGFEQHVLMLNTRQIAWHIVDARADLAEHRYGKARKSVADALKLIEAMREAEPQTRMRLELRTVERKLDFLKPAQVASDLEILVGRYNLVYGSYASAASLDHLLRAQELAGGAHNQPGPQPGPQRGLASEPKASASTIKDELAAADATFDIPQLDNPLGATEASLQSAQELIRKGSYGKAESALIHAELKNTLVAAAVDPFSP